MSDLELVDVVSENDEAVEARTLADCLRIGLLHRSIIAFLRNSKGEIFLQQRSKEDEWLPGYWTASCTGHVRSTENSTDAARRELNEELGVSCMPAYLFKFTVPRIEFRGRVEHEIANVFEATSDEPIHFDSREVQQVISLSLPECKTFFRMNKREITLDAHLAFQKYSTLVS